MLASFWAVLPMLAPADIELDYRSQEGLTVRYRGVPVVRGSFFQFYEANWVRGYYSSNWNPQTVTKAGGAITVTFRSTDGRASGELKFTPQGSGFRSEYTFRWGGDAPVFVENTLGFLWAPAFTEGKVAVSAGTPLRRSMGDRPTVATKMDDRVLGEDARWQFDAPLGQMTVESVEGGPVRVFDARAYEQDWADSRDLLWAGWTGLMVPNGGETRAVANWSFSPPATVPVAPSPAANPSWTRLPDAVGPYTPQAALLPVPKSMAELGPGVGATLPSRRVLTQGPGIPAQAVEELSKQLGRRFADLPATGTPARIRVARDATLPAGGFSLRIDGGQIAVGTRDDTGARQALHALGQLARVEDGQVVLPRVSIRDWPSAPFRGIHLFVGPEAPAFQRKLMARLFGPLGLSHVVLQAERTEWKAAPGIRTGETMSKAALRQLFQDYRAMGIEPIPLIQSWGHMGWLFANGQNRDLAYNPQQPFGIDVRLPQARAKVEAIWDEAIELLGPDIIHVGLDEVDLRGGPIPPKELTQQWTDYLPWLGDYAQRKGVKLMLWGDKILAPGEAPDATHGTNRTEAKARRASVPDGSYLADWHYKNDPNPAIYTSLDLLKQEGLIPVASTWYRPGNIVGFFRAAQERGMGGLHTTWAGYTSTEANMLRAEDQFASYVIAGDMLWSGKYRNPSELAYDPKTQLFRMVYAPPTPSRPVAGWTLGQAMGTPFTVGDVRFMPLSQGELFFPLTSSGAAMPTSRTWEVGRPAREVNLALATLTQVDGSQEVGQVRVTLGDGTVRTVPVRYGWHVRTKSDPQGTLQTARDAEGRSVVRIDLGPKPVPVKSVTVQATAPEAGLFVAGITIR